MMYRQSLLLMLVTLAMALLSAPPAQAYLAVEEDPVGQATQAQPTQPDNTDEAAPAEPAEVEMTVRVKSIRGKASYRMAETDDWTAIKQGDVLPIGATIRTGLRGNVMLALGPNADFEVRHLTEMTIADLQKDGDTIRTLLMMPRGNFNMEVKHVGLDNDFQIASPTGTMAVRGTATTGNCYGGGLNLNPSAGNKDNAINQQNNNGQSENLSGGEGMNNGQGQTSPNQTGKTGAGQTGMNNNTDGSKGGDTGGNDGLTNATNNLRGSQSLMSSMRQAQQLKDSLGGST